MKTFLVSLISALFLFAKTTSADPTEVLAAHTEALKAFRDAIEVDVEGTATLGFKKDFAPILAPIHVAIKREKTISEIRNLLAGANFRGNRRHRFRRQAYQFRCRFTLCSYEPQWRKGYDSLNRK